MRLRNAVERQDLDFVLTSLRQGTYLETVLEHIKGPEMALLARLSLVPGIRADLLVEKWVKYADKHVLTTYLAVEDFDTLLLSTSPSITGLSLCRILHQENKRCDIHSWARHLPSVKHKLGYSRHLTAIFKAYSQEEILACEPLTSALYSAPPTFFHGAPGVDNYPAWHFEQLAQKYNLFDYLGIVWSTYESNSYNKKKHSFHLELLNFPKSDTLWIHIIARCAARYSHFSMRQGMQELCNKHVEPPLWWAQKDVSHPVVQALQLCDTLELTHQQVIELYPLERAIPQKIAPALMDLSPDLYSQ